MFGWRRSATRPVRVTLVPGTLRGRGSVPPHAASAAGASHSGKQVIAYALAHPPTWTNHLMMTDPRGRAANTQTPPAHPGVVPLAANPLPALPDGAGR